MKFHGKKGTEIFNPSTKCTLGRFDSRTGIFETEDAEIIKQIEMEGLAFTEAPEEELVKDLSIDADLQRLPKNVLLERYGNKIEGAERMNKKELIDAILAPVEPGPDSVGEE